MYQSIMEDEGETLKHLALIKELVEADILNQVMDRCYLLEGIVEAHRYTVRRGCMSTTSRS